MKKMPCWTEIELWKSSDGRGDLIPLEFYDEEYPHSPIPFQVKRSYFISAPTNEDKAVRGKHAHYNLQQVIICVHGDFYLSLEDEAGHKQDFHLNKNNKAIHINNHGLVWRELRHFSPNCVVLVYASEHFNEQDYIRSYADFKQKSLEKTCLYLKKCREKDA